MARSYKRDVSMLGFEARFDCKKKRKRSKKELSCDELKELLRLVTEQSFTQREAAKLFGVKPQLVARVVRNEKLKKNAVSHLEAKQKTQKERRGQIKACVEEHVRSNWHIWTTQQVREALV